MVLNTIKRLLYGLCFVVPITLLMLIISLSGLFAGFFVIVAIVFIIYLAGAAIEDELKWRKNKWY